MYGSGVHAYFSLDYQRAYDDFTSAIDGGTTDPRCFYFRGLCYLNLGREEEAKIDFEQAARLEAEDVNQFYNVGRALERIQGNTRLLVEEYRVEARMEAMRRAEALRQQRYGELRAAEERVLETQAEAAPETPVEIPADQPAVPDDPFGIGPTQQTTVGPDDVPATPPAEEAPAMEQPAETPAAPEPVEEDPFAVQPAAATEPAPAPAPAPVPAEAVPPDVNGAGVFGALGKALGKAVTGDEAQTPAADQDDPFGLGAPAPPPADEAAPAEPPTDAPEEDPFGAAVPAPAAAPADDSDPFGLGAPAENMPAAPADDPFAEEPAEKADEGAANEAAPAPNPFGEDPFKE
jgi:hypothetical protein